MHVQGLMNGGTDMRRLGWGMAALLGLLVATYALGALAMPGVRSPLIIARLRTVPLALILHLAGGAVAVGLGAFQLSARIRARHLPAHRWLGRCYLVGVLVGGGAGLFLATMADGGLVARTGFGLLAILWIASTITAYTCIRQGRVALHRAWMSRSYSLTFAGVTLRIWLPLSQAAGLPFVEAYQVISWLCWVPNLIVVEWLVLSRQVDTRDLPNSRAKSAVEPVPSTGRSYGAAS